MIPKIIHCCWFGGTPLPHTVKRYMGSWREKLPDYQIMVWTEKEFDVIHSPQYVNEAYACKKYAFVSDYVRLYALYKYGGIYMDTDVEVIKSLDTYLQHKSFIGFECNFRLSTAVIASEAGSEWIKALLDEYEERIFLSNGKMDLTTNVEYITKYFIQNGLQEGDKKQKVQDVEIYPSEYFSPKSWSTGVYNITEKTVVIHHFAGTWHSPLTRFLSIFFSNKTIVGIAAYKEKLLSYIKNVRA